MGTRAAMVGGAGRGLPQLLAWRERVPKGLRGALLWLSVWFAGLSVLRLLPGTVGTLSAVLQAMVGVALLFVGVPVLWRVVRRRLLWSLRNKLVLTYLLIGLAPVVLFGTLALVMAYVAAGQFAIHLADTRLQSRLDQLDGLNTLDARTLEAHLRQAAGQPGVDAGQARFVEPGLQRRGEGPVPKMALFLNGVPFVAEGSATEDGSPGVAPWATRLDGGKFNGMVIEGASLYLLAIRQVEVTPGQRYSLVSTLPVNQALMRDVARGLGRAGLVGVRTTEQGDGPAGGESGAAMAEEAPTRRQRRAVTPDAATAASRRKAMGDAVGRGLVFGGLEPPMANLADLRVRFLSTLPAVDWDTGVTSNIPIEVDSRPSRLYAQLFGASLGGVVTRVLRVGLLVLCGLFALIEVAALWMAMRLSRTVTASVTDLYAATQRVEEGDLRHTIRVERDDQMAELSRSFNTMMGSLQRSIEEQKASQRLQNEVAIAQEVQANLFPRAIGDLPTLELHGMCRPARGVSGDYYDFLLLGEDRGRGKAPTGGVGIALGDISGKGISAALLMATLHSAVRAYRLASEQLKAQGHRVVDEAGAARETEMFEQPGALLALLNRHLYRSTQPEKYATLFLAHYHGAEGEGRLTYSNAGQLPPLVLRQDGSVRRLECGGTVVGLLDGMSYDQETVMMGPGDLMVAYSDGVTEPENDFGDFGEERLVEVVQRYRDEPLHVISAQVMLALDAWIGAEEQPDDITLVLARQL